MAPSELDSTRVVETVEPERFPPLPEGVSFQDIDSESGSDEWDEEAAMAAPDAFSEEEADEMVSFLKERGLFAFVKHYVEVHKMPIPRVLLAFGVLLVSDQVSSQPLELTIRRQPAEMSLQDQLRVLKVTCSRV